MPAVQCPSAARKDMRLMNNKRRARPVTEVTCLQQAEQAVHAVHTPGIKVVIVPHFIGVGHVLLDKCAPLDA